ncbi:hypothetical protein [Chlorobium limicola]
MTISFSLLSELLVTGTIRGTNLTNFGKDRKTHGRNDSVTDSIMPILNSIHFNHSLISDPATMAWKEEKGEKVMKYRSVAPALLSFSCFGMGLHGVRIHAFLQYDEAKKQVSAIDR